MTNKIQCFFYGISYGEYVSGRPVGLFGFAIPDMGIIYKSKCNGTIYECQYAGLLALLKFIDSNYADFKDYQFEILTDSTLLVHQIAYKKIISPALAPFYMAVMELKNKIDFRVTWVPRHENQAVSGIDDSKPFQFDIKLKYKIDGSNFATETPLDPNSAI